MPTESIRFPGSAGEELAGRLELPPDDAPRAYALFAHCFTCTKNLKAAVNLSRALSARGIAVLRFDFTGLGESEGDFAETNFSSNVEDLVAAARYLEEIVEAPRLLVGHSLGGAAVLHAAARLEGTRAVATIGAPADPAHVLRHLEGHESEIEETGIARVRLAGRPFAIKRQFLEDLRAQTMEEVVRSLDPALLILHSPRDQIVGIENAARLYGYAKHPKSFVSLDDADHLLSVEADSRYAGAVLAAWSSRYLPEPAAEESEDELRSADRVIVHTGRAGYRTEIVARHHRLVSDEPRQVGGTDEGPTPYDLVTAGLGACTSMTLRMYADRKEWPLEGVVVRLKHTKIHAQDEAACESGEPKLDRIVREISLDGPLDPDQRDRLIEIANRCPVHRTLEAGVEVETVPVEPAPGEETEE